MPDQLKPLVHMGAFIGADLTTEPAFLTEGMGSATANVDISANPKAFTLARGRTAGINLGIPSGYTVQAMAAYTSFTGPGTDPVRAATESCRWVFFSAVNGAGDSFQGVYNSFEGTSTQLTGLSPFTQAIQFQDTLYTNGGGGQQVKMRSWGSDSSTGQQLYIAPWQFGLNGDLGDSCTWSVNTTSTSGPGAGVYSYAIVWVCFRPGIYDATAGDVQIPFIPLDTTVQFSHPQYLVTNSASNLPLTVAIPDSMTAPVIGLDASFISGTFGGSGDDVIALLYRASVLQPVYYQTGVFTSDSITDTNSDTTIRSYPQLITANNAPPTIFQDYYANTTI